MIKSTIPVYLHLENVREPKKIEIPENGAISEVVAIIRNELPETQEEIRIFLEEDEEAIRELIKIEESGIRHKSHIHCHRCKDVKVSVVYNGGIFEHDFSPSTRAAKIIHKSVKHFGITEEEAKKLILTLKDKTEVKDKQPVGVFVEYPKCQITLYLVNPNPVQG